MNILVTGGAGFVGSHVVEALQEAGHRTIVIDNLDDAYDPDLKRENLAGPRQHEAFLEECVDIRDLSRLKEAFQSASPEVVIHLAARPGVRDSVRNPALAMQVNVQGPFHVLEATIACGARRLIFASSSSVYGGSHGRPSRETDRPAPASPYAGSKLCGEVLCETYGRLHGLETICLRLFTVFGPRQRPDMAIHRFVSRILSGEPVSLRSAESSARDYTFVADVATAFVAAVDSDASGHIVNVGSGRPIPLPHVMDALARALGRQPEVEHQPLSPSEPIVTWADTTKAADLLGFEPKVSFEHGIARFIDWFQESGCVIRQQ